MKELEFYQHSFRQLKVGEAWAFLSSLDCLDDVVLMWNSHEVKFNRTNPRDIFDMYGQMDLCEDIGPVQFSGGPPGNIIWATGTMKTFVMDRIMSHVAREEKMTKEFGPKVRERVRVRC
jgi:hypothetical protein